MIETALFTIVVLLGSWLCLRGVKAALRARQQRRPLSQPLAGIAFALSMTLNVTAARLSLFWLTMVAAALLLSSFLLSLRAGSLNPLRNL